MQIAVFVGGPLLETIVSRMEVALREQEPAIHHFIRGCTQWKRYIFPIVLVLRLTSFEIKETSWSKLKTNY